MSEGAAPAAGLPPAVVKVIEEALGTILVGAFLNCTLFGLELSQLWKYFQLFPTDRFAIRCLVIFMFLVDCVATANFCAMSYLYVIKNYGNMAYLLEQNNTVPVYSISMAVSVICMHGFLIYRYLVLSKNYIVSAFLALLAITAFVGDSLATMAVIKYTALADREKLSTFATIWLTAASAADVLIACALIWELSRVKSSFRKTNSLIRRLITTAVMTGSATAALAICALSVYKAKPETNLCLTFGFLIGRACTLTVIYNLNMRKAQTGHYLSNGETNMMTGPTSGQSLPMESGFHFTQGHGGSKTAINGISVHSVTHIDKGADDGSYEGKQARELV